MSLSNPKSVITEERLAEFYQAILPYFSISSDDNNIQVDTMETPTIELLGTIVQYVGMTTVDYTNGYFYECVSNSGVYSWQQVDMTVALTAAELQEIKNAFVMKAPVQYAANPTGCIIQMMGVTAPLGYLACDGTIYNIADYQNLANYFTAQFGSANNFGGDGTTTFAVPDLRGEFLRGTGTNSHSDGGNGANVGVHQTPTGHVEVVLNQGKYFGPSHDESDTSRLGATNIDKILVTRSETNTPYLTCSFGSDGSSAELYASRPTNTSVLYCIKY